MNPRQEKFIAEFLVDQNGTRAAERAGYTGGDRALTVHASRLLMNADIKAAIDAGLAKQISNIERRAEAKQITKERWLDELAAMGFSDVMDLMTFQQDGKLTMTAADIKTRGLGRLIRKMTVLPGGKLQIEMHAKIPALDLMAKHFGWVKEHVEHSGSIGQPPLSKQDFQKIFSDPEAEALTLQLAAKLSKPAGKTAKGN